MFPCAEKKNGNNRTGGDEEGKNFLEWLKLIQREWSGVTGNVKRRGRTERGKVKAKENKWGGGDSSDKGKGVTL